MALVDDDEIEKVSRVVAKHRGRFALGVRAGHKGLEDGEEDIAVFRCPFLFPDLVRRDPHQRILREGREAVKCLIGQNIAIGQKQNARAACRFAVALPIVQVPAAVKQLPGKLKGNKGLAGSGR